MATLKHINSKNADYGAAEQYLLFEHDEFTMKPVLDETGRLIPREDGLHGKLVMLKKQVLLGGSVVGIFRVDMLECCQPRHLLS